MDRSTLQRHPAADRAAVDRKGMSEDEILCFLGKAARRDQVIFIVSPPKHHCLIGAAEARHRLHQRVENRLEIDGGAADDLEHVGGGCLLLQGLPQFVKQPHVLDRDHRLVRKGGNKFDLLLCEGSHVGSRKEEDAERLAIS